MNAGILFLLSLLILSSCLALDLRRAYSPSNLRIVSSFPTMLSMQRKRQTAYSRIVAIYIPQTIGVLTKNLSPQSV